MNHQLPIVRAAQNNALWCDAISRAHDVPGKFHDTYWINPGPVPPYTSKLITLAGAEHAATQLAAIRSLCATESGFSVKDAFQCLDLAALGFGVLFTATWIVCAPETAVPADPDREPGWSVVRGSDELAEWERVWRGSPANAAVEESARIFVPSLLEEPGIHFLAGSRESAVVASGALIRTGHVVGLSNVFSNDADAGPLFPGCVRLARELYPGLPVVGYARGEDLVAAETAGFARVHGLTVWEWSAP